MHYKHLFTITALAILITLVGCESSDEANGNVWKKDYSNSSSITTPPSENTTSTSTSDVNTIGDAIDYSSLSWSFGGVKGGSAKISTAAIGNLSISGNTLAYNWTGEDLSAWGLSRSDHTGAYACLFVKRSDGKWVGGKFDWISSSRTTRSLTNINNNYIGWSLAGVPNPCDAAFVIISKDCKKRTNVITTTWSR